MDTDELILASANAAVSFIGTERYKQLTETGLSLVADELRRHIEPSSRPGLLIVAFPRIANVRDPAGFMLVQEGRTILAWSVGVLRPRSDSVVLPITTGDQIAHTATIPKTWRQPEKFVLDLVGPPTYHVEVFNEGNMSGLLNLARMFACGAAQLS
jgi:hypothetical protein